MKILKQGLIAGLTLLGAVVALPSAYAIPTNSGSLEYEGAVFTLAAVETDAASFTYEITYQANFDDFTNAAEQPIFYALDWKWGQKISSLLLKEAPGGVDNWSADTFNKVNNGGGLGCSKGGSDAAVCSQATSIANGIDTASASGNLSWVYEAVFEKAIDVTAVAGNTLRGGYIDATGKKAGAIMSCETGLDNDLCSPYVGEDPDPDPDPDPVPVPGTVLLFGLGLAGLIRARKNRGRSED